MFSRFLPFALLICLLNSACSTLPKPVAADARKKPLIHTVRTTAYTHTEAGGARNAIGGRLVSGEITSAAADWSRYPLGTLFKVRETGELFRIEDYGSALVGTDTIDLYKTSNGSMRGWGVRYIEIEVLEWGSRARSLHVLQPRARSNHVRRMVDELQKQT